MRQYCLFLLVRGGGLLGRSGCVGVQARHLIELVEASLKKGVNALGR